MQQWSKALMESLSRAPLLVGELPEASVLDRSLLGHPAPEFRLNFQQKLGHLYEDALQHLLEQSTRLTVLASHLQVINQAGVTLGEMDYVLRDEAEQEYFQLELAVKFYLARRTADGWCYPGPDPRDNWYRKLKRMQTHQLRLAERAETIDLLRNRYGITQIAVRQLIYGRLFYPISESDHPLPTAMAVDGLRGRWLSFAEWGEWMASSTELRVMPKPLWPALLNEELVSSLPTVSKAELFQLAEQRCTMFIADDCLEPFFLVPDSWYK